MVFLLIAYIGFFFIPTSRRLWGGFSIICRQLSKFRSGFSGPGGSKELARNNLLHI